MAQLSTVGAAGEDVNCDERRPPSDSMPAPVRLYAGPCQTLCLRLMSMTHINDDVRNAVRDNNSGGNETSDADMHAATPDPTDMHAALTSSTTDRV